MTDGKGNEFNAIYLQNAKWLKTLNLFKKKNNQMPNMKIARFLS